MATISELQAKIPGALTVAEIDAYGPEGIVRTIASAQTAKVGGDDGEEKPVITFEEDAKVLVINKTRGQQLADLFGAANDPTGQKVKLVVKKVKVGNRPMDIICIDAAE